MGTLTSPELTIEEKVKRVVAIELDTLSPFPILPGYILSELHHHPERVVQFMEGLAGARVAEAVPAAVAVLEGQLTAAAREGRIRPISAAEFVVNLLSLCIFPFAARPMLGVALGLKGEAFQAFIAERRTQLPVFILNALRP
jgi:hypothetical protein